MRGTGKKIDTGAAQTAKLRRSGQISETEKQALFKHGHHVEHTPEDEMNGAYKKIQKTVKTRIHIPEERLVKVPVVRKEKEKIVEKHVVRATKLVPVTKYKEVEEIGLHDRAVQPGEKARSGNHRTQVLKTSQTAARTRKIPYTDFEEHEYEVVVDVPREVVKTRVGHRMDKQLHSHVVEVEEDCVYELRPVLVSKGNSRATELRDKETHGKALHGDPIWADGLHDGWRPEFGCLTPTGSRPGTAGSRPSTAGSRPGSRSGSRPGTSYTERPGTPLLERTRARSSSGLRPRSATSEVQRF